MYFITNIKARKYILCISKGLFFLPLETFYFFSQNTFCYWWKLYLHSNLGKRKLFSGDAVYYINFSTSVCNILHLQYFASAIFCICNILHLQYFASEYFAYSKYFRRFFFCICNILHLKYFALAIFCICNILHLQYFASAVFCICNILHLQYFTSVINIYLNNRLLNWK